jgi:hypothetical protein
MKFQKKVGPNEILYLLHQSSPLGSEPTKESNYACQWYVHELVNIKTTCLCDIN